MSDEREVAAEAVRAAGAVSDMEDIVAGLDEAVAVAMMRGHLVAFGWDARHVGMMSDAEVKEAAARFYEVMGEAFAQFAEWMSAEAERVMADYATAGESVMALMALFENGKR